MNVNPIIPLFSAVWHPQRAFARLNNVSVVALAFAFCLIEFVLALTLWGSFHSAAEKVVVANPVLTAGQIPFIVGVSVVFAALTNIFLITVVSLILQAVVAIAGKSVRFQDIFGMLILAYVPALIVQASRSIAILFGMSLDAAKKLFTLGQIFATRSDSELFGVLSIYDLGDIWTFALVIIGFCHVSKMKRLPAVVCAVLVWGTLLMLLGRLQSFGSH